VGPDRLDLALTFEGARAAGLTLGSGVVIVFDDTVDLQQVVLRIARFFRDESCGQCVPCRIGTVRQEEVLRRLTARPEPGGVAPEDLLLLDDLAHVMREASICGLGQTATSAVLSAVRDFGLFR
jgi:NADH-quinone oxidoreductase subunit F